MRISTLFSMVAAQICISHQQYAMVPSSPLLANTCLLFCWGLVTYSLSWRSSRFYARSFFLPSLKCSYFSKANRLKGKWSYIEWASNSHSNYSHSREILTSTMFLLSYFTEGQLILCGTSIPVHFHQIYWGNN